MKRSLILTVLSFLILAQLGLAQMPQTISYQGVLRDPGTKEIVPNDNYDLTFRLYDASDGGAEWWSETHVGVQVTDGIFNVILGSINSFISTDPKTRFEIPYWLEIDVGTLTLSPRIQLTAVPYSLAARSVQGYRNVFPSNGNVGIGTTTPGAKLHIQSPNLDGIVLTDSTTGAYRATLLNRETYGGQLNLNDAADGAVKAVIRGYATVDGWQASFTAGNVGIGTDRPEANLQVVGNWTLGSPEFQSPPGGFDSWLSANNGILYEGGGADYTHHFSAYGGGDIARFGISTGVGVAPDTRVVITNSGNVGIGTTSPSQKLDVNGTVLANGFALNNSNTRISSLTTDNIDLITSNAARVRIDPSGDVGIGTINPSAKLDVAGDANVQGNLVASGDVSTQGTLTALGDANIGGAITIPATTRYFSIPAAAFQGGGNVPYIADEDMGSMPYNISAPVHLPHGATIKEFLARVYDGHSTEDITVSLKYAGEYDITYTNIITMTSGWEGGDVPLESTTLDHTVDNVNNVYAVTASWMSPMAPDYAEIKFRNVRITYTVTNPLP